MERTAALESWVKTLAIDKSVRGMKTEGVLASGGAPAAALIARVARAIVEEDGGHASPKACAAGDEWGQARSLARKFSEAQCAIVDAAPSPAAVGVATEGAAEGAAAGRAA